MEKGSSTETPISSIPSNRKAMMTAEGTVAQPQDEYRDRGRKASQMVRKRDVCLQG
jgi:hypothetical protein